MEGNKMIKEAIIKIVNKEDLTYDEAYDVMNEIMSGETTSTQNAAFLASLSTKSVRAETTDEIAGCAAAMRDNAIRVDTGMELFEIVGTGGGQCPQLQYFHYLGTGGGGRRDQGGETWQPRCLFPVRHSGLSGGSWRKYPAESRAVYPAFEGGGNVFLLRSGVSHLYEICGRDPQGTWFPHGVQYSGTPDQSRQSRYAAPWGV